MESKSEKKNRLSRLLGKREKSPNPMVMDPDSAYASSETPSAEPSKDTVNSTPDTVPVEKNSEMANIDQDRNLVVRPATGEVLDRDTGEVVTVVTTTTTTTTTTTRKPGQTPEVNKEVQQQIQENKPIPALKTLPSTTGPSEMPANPAITSSNPPDRSSSVQPLADSPPIPTRSAARRSGEFGNRKSQASTYPGYDENMPPPTGGYYGSGAADARSDSPSRHNFSYPARNRKSMDPDGLPATSGTGWSTTDQPQHNSKSTMGDLRAAAKGLHGIGETLRGTLNKTVDDRFPRHNAEKNAYATAKNEETLAKGRLEMGGIPHRDRGRDGGPIGRAHTPVTSPGNFHPPPPMSPPVSPPDTAHPPHHPHHTTTTNPTVPPSHPPNTSMLGTAPPPPSTAPTYNRTPTSDQRIPGSFSEDDAIPPPGAPGGPPLGPSPGDMESERREKQKARSIGKLFKRKPVGPKEESSGGLRVTNP